MGVERVIRSRPEAESARIGRFERALSARSLDHGHRVASSALNDDCSPVDAVSNLGIGVVDERFHRFRPDTVAIDTQAVPGIDYTTD